jgi:hypothetical protein
VATLNVSTLGETSAGNNGYFSVGSKDLKVGDDLVKVFEYSTAREADAEARLISSEGQPDPRMAIARINAPNFYKHGLLGAMGRWVGVAAARSRA